MADAPDVLEKLIQIPFWIRVPSAAAAGYMVAHLASLSDDSEPSPNTPGFSTGPEVGAREEDTAVPEVPRKQPLANDLPIETARATYELRWTFTPAEVDFMSSLAGLGNISPRRLKRLIVTYRLIRLTIPDVQYGEFLESAYAAILAQLVIVIMAPAHAARYLQVLRDERLPLSTLPGLNSYIESEFDHTPTRTFIQDVLDTYQHTQPVNPVEDLRRWSTVATRHSFT